MRIKTSRFSAILLGATGAAMLGLTANTVQAAPVGGNPAALKATAGEGSAVQETHYRRRHRYYYYDGYHYGPRRYYYGYGPSYRYYYGHRHRYHRHHHHRWW